MMSMQENQMQTSAGAASAGAVPMGTSTMRSSIPGANNSGAGSAGAGSMGVNSTGMSYQQFQHQLHVKQEQEAAVAQKAIVSAGLDSFSQQVLNTVQRLRQISQDLGNGQKQLEAQMAAQQRQVMQMQQNIENICNELQNSYKPGGFQGRLQ